MARLFAVTAATHLLLLRFSGVAYSQNTRYDQNTLNSDPVVSLGSGEPVSNVLIVAEGRSGSTLLLGLLGLEKGTVFSVSEPWHDFPPDKQKALPGLGLVELFNCSFASDMGVLSAVGW